MTWIDVIAAILVLSILADDDRTFWKVVGVALLWFVVKVVIL